MLSNVLAPVWGEMPVLNGKVLKRQGGPFYPASYEKDLDCLVGIGVASISGLNHVRDHEKRWRLEGSYSLNRDFANRILESAVSFDDERRLVGFIQELAFALSALSGTQSPTRTTTQDATYSDRLIDFGNVVDFCGVAKEKLHGERGKPVCYASAECGRRRVPGEKLHPIPVRHLQERMHGAR